MRWAGARAVPAAQRPSRLLQQLLRQGARPGLTASAVLAPEPNAAAQGGVRASAAEPRLRRYDAVLPPRTEVLRPPMSVIAVVGAQWGDEGKGRVVDYLAADADLVIRYGGGNNAGHTVVNPHGHFKLHLIPSGIFYPGTRNLLGNGRGDQPAGAGARSSTAWRRPDSAATTSSSATARTW